MSKRIVRTVVRVLIDRRRTLSLTALALMAGLLFWGRLLMQDVPRTAVAEPDALLAQQLEPVDPADSDDAVRAPLAPPDRNPFRFAEGSTGEANRASEKNGGAAQKSAHETSDEQQRREKEIREAAAGLSLQQTRLATPPRARINGRLVSPGQTVHGFYVRDIFQGKVVLQKDGVLIVLEM